MAKTERKSVAPAPAEAVPVETVVPAEAGDASGNMVAVTVKELAACIACHERELANHIRDPGSPSDGSVLTILQTLDRLRQLIPTKEMPHDG